MAATVVNDFLKPRYNENLPNRVQTDVAELDFNDYSTTDVTVGAGDTLEMALLTVPAGTIINDVWVSVNTANGGALTATVTDGTSAIHGNTFDLNSAGLDLEVATTRVFDTETTLYLVFPNSAVVKPALEVEVGIELKKGSWL